MNPLYEMIIYTIMFIVIMWQYSTRDAQGMDSYDRYSGVAGDGRTRGMIGTVYNADGTYAYTYNLIDTNPAW